MGPVVTIIEPEKRAAELVALWNAAAGEEFPLDERLLSQQLRLDADPRRCFAVLEPSGAISAAALVKKAARPGVSGSAPDTGFVSLLVVDEARRRAGLASALLREARAWLGPLGASRIRLGSDHYHLLPGRPAESGAGYEALEAFARAEGFIGHGTVFDMIADISSPDIASPDSPASGATPPPETNGGDYVFRLSRRGEREAVMEFMRAGFPGRWTSEASEAFDAGMRPSDLALTVERSSGAIVGFARIYDGSSPVLGPSVYWRGLLGEGYGGLGPMGITGSRRGSGLGIGLLRYCIAALRARGVRSMAIDWTDLTDFYGKIGFKAWKRYELMSAGIRRP